MLKGMLSQNKLFWKRQKIFRWYGMALLIELGWVFFFFLEIDKIPIQLSLS